MEKQLKVIYHYNSGFSVQVGSTLLVFDYWEGEGRKLADVGRITTQSLSVYEEIIVFVSHGHHDHFDSIIYQWPKENPDLNITYIVASDMPIGIRGKRMAPLQERQLTKDIYIKAYQSTDTGVAFMVKIFDFNIFHAGDLNMWHWRQESSLHDIEIAEKAYYDAVAPLEGERIDLCMFPVDPRQGMMYDAGANHFILTFKPRVFIPMHWQERAEVAHEFARRARTSTTEVLALTKPGIVANITYSNNHIDIYIIEPPKEYDVRTRPLVKFEGGNKEDPFVDTDLPIDL